MTLHDISSERSHNDASQRPQLTDRTIRALRPGPKQRDVRDTQVKWLALRVNRTSKVWVYRGRINGGRGTRHRLGEYPAMGLAEARAEALRWRAEIAAGRDPAKPKPTVHRFSDVCEAFFASQARRKLRQGHIVEYDVRRLLLPLWGTWGIAEITRADVTDLLQSVIEQGHPALAHR